MLKEQQIPVKGHFLTAVPKVPFFGWREGAQLDAVVECVPKQMGFLC